MGVRQLAVANGPNIFQMLLVYFCNPDNYRRLLGYQRCLVCDLICVLHLQYLDYFNTVLS